MTIETSALAESITVFLTGNVSHFRAISRPAEFCPRSTETFEIDLTNSWEYLFLVLVKVNVPLPETSVNCVRGP